MIRRNTAYMRLTGACVLVTLLAAAAVRAQQTTAFRLESAALDADNRLALPGDTDRWIAVGSSIGGEYSDEPFDPANPGAIGVVQMEPAAYDYFLENGVYADGTMFLLSFYRTQEKPEPELPGFVQGDLAQQEIHLIDRQRFPEEGRAFFLFLPGSSAPSSPLPLGSPCFVCHIEHGEYDGTFRQFYPQLREHFVDLTN